MWNGCLPLSAAGFGLSWGALLGYLRAQNVPFYAASMGLNYALFAGTFFGASLPRTPGPVFIPKIELVVMNERPLALLLVPRVRAGTRQLLTELDPTVPRMNSAIAGSITGGVLTTVFSAFHTRGM